MMSFETIEVTHNQKRGIIVLNRPQVHNAINAKMIHELRKAFDHLTRQKDIRVIILMGKGKSFCSGADLNYMREQAGMSKKQNLEDSRQLAEMFKDIYTCPVPVITVSHGTVAGGANGIVAASDYAIALPNTGFRFSEVHLGLVPATIAPYVLDRIGRTASLEMMLSGKTFSEKEAEKLGLVNKLVKSEDLEMELNNYSDLIMRGGPEAIKNTKKLILELNKYQMNLNLLPEMTSSVIAEARASEEGIEGMSSFFEKRKPRWTNEGIQ